ncbi:small ribosomal subunit protein bS21m-like [Branchiostoma floridae x Branchiostoma belcheri]
MIKYYQFIGRTVFVKNGNVDAAYRALNNVLTREGFIDDVRRRRYFEKPWQYRRRVNYENMREIYNKEMARRIDFTMRKSRPNPWVG